MQPLMQSQQGRLTDLSWDFKAPGSIVTASDDGSVCVWDAQVLIDIHWHVKIVHDIAVPQLTPRIQYSSDG